MDYNQEDNWPQELSEWYIPEEDRDIKDSSEKYDGNPFKDISEEIDLDQLDINDLKYEDDSFIDQLFANLEAKKSRSVEQKENNQSSKRQVSSQEQKGRTKKAFAVASKMFENGIDPDRDVFDALAKARLMNALGTLLMLAVITTIFIGVPYYLWSS